VLGKLRSHVDLNARCAVQLKPHEGQSWMHMLTSRVNADGCNKLAHHKNASNAHQLSLGSQTSASIAASFTK